MPNTKRGTTQDNPAHEEPKLALDRLKEESDKAYTAFRAFIDLGDGRTLTKLSHKLKKTKTHLGEWSRKFHWQERLAKYHTEQAQARSNAEQQAELERARIREQRRNVLEEQAWDVSRKLIKKAEEILDFPIAKRVVKDGGKTITIMPANFRPGDAARLIDIADSVGRLAVRLPSRVTEVTGKGGKDLMPEGSALIPPRINARFMTDKETQALLKKMQDEADA